jgi:hypothetical protein
MVLKANCGRVWVGALLISEWAGAVALARDAHI